MNYFTYEIYKMYSHALLNIKIDIQLNAQN